MKNLYDNKLKTRVALNIIDLLIHSNPEAFALIVVPTEVLKKQWTEQLEDRCLIDNCRVEIINSVIKKNWECDLLIVDEVHVTGSQHFSQVFQTVKFNLILCLTGTLERLDGKEEIIKQYAPVCDHISFEEAEQNGWVSPIKEYLVLLDVDLTEYNHLNNQFNGHFAFFGWDFNMAMKCGTDFKYRQKIAKEMGVSLKEVTAHAFGFLSTMKKRKAFVQSHPKKIEICRKILKKRLDKKCITFSATIQDSEKIGIGDVLHSKQSKKINAKILETFNKAEKGVLNSSKACDVGVDVKGLSVGIILSTDSSKIRKGQRVGRICRMEPGKEAEMFTLVIRGTQEVGWANNSSTHSFITINEQQLDDVLNYKNLDSRQRQIITTNKFRF